MKRLALLALLALACGGAAQNVKGPLTYSTTARMGYENGMRAMQKGNYLEAIGHFTGVKRRFPYSKWALLAELRIADAHFEREQYLEAIDAYKLFIKFHPTNENIPYAQYRIALAHMKQGPEDWWFLPPAYEKDLTAIHDAVKEIKKFLRAYPGSGLVPKARELLKQCERKLADHELYVAKFYMDQGRWKASSLRLEYIVLNLQTMASDPEVLYLLGKTYLRLKEPRKATLVFSKLAREHPQSRYRGEVVEYLKAAGMDPGK